MEKKPKMYSCCIINPNPIKIKLKEIVPKWSKTLTFDLMNNGEQSLPKSFKLINYQSNIIKFKECQIRTPQIQKPSTTFPITITLNFEKDIHPGEYLVIGQIALEENYECFTLPIEVEELKQNEENNYKQESTKKNKNNKLLNKTSSEKAKQITFSNKKVDDKTQTKKEEKKNPLKVSNPISSPSSTNPKLYNSKRGKKLTQKKEINEHKEYPNQKIDIIQSEKNANINEETQTTESINVNFPEALQKCENNYYQIESKYNKLVIENQKNEEKIVCLTDEIQQLKVENEQLKVKLKNEIDLSKKLKDSYFKIVNENLQLKKNIDNKINKDNTIKREIGNISNIDKYLLKEKTSSIPNNQKMNDTLNKSHNNMKEQPQNADGNKQEDKTNFQSNDYQIQKEEVSTLITQLDEKYNITSIFEVHEIEKAIIESKGDEEKIQKILFE